MVRGRVPRRAQEAINHSNECEEDDFASMRVAQPLRFRLARGRVLRALRHIARGAMCSILYLSCGFPIRYFSSHKALIFLRFATTTSRLCACYVGYKVCYARYLANALSLTPSLNLTLRSEVRPI